MALSSIEYLKTEKRIWKGTKNVKEDYVGHSGDGFVISSNS